MWNRIKQWSENVSTGSKAILGIGAVLGLLYSSWVWATGDFASQRDVKEIREIQRENTETIQDITKATKDLVEIHKQQNQIDTLQKCHDRGVAPKDCPTP